MFSWFWKVNVNVRLQRCMFFFILFFWISFQASDDNSFLEHIPFGILTVISEESPHSSLLIHTDSVSTAIVIEGDIVMDQIKDMPLAVCLLFGLSYALNLDYPKGMKNTFYFIQQVLLDLGAKILKPKLQTLKNQLFSWRRCLKFNGWDNLTRISNDNYWKKWKRWKYFLCWVVCSWFNYLCNSMTHFSCIEYFHCPIYAV